MGFRGPNSPLNDRGLRFPENETGFQGSNQEWNSLVQQQLAPVQGSGLGMRGSQARLISQANHASSGI